MNMKHLLLSFALLAQFVQAQYFGTRELVVQEVNVPGMPGLQSFAWGQHDGQWFLIGGRTDGLHRRQPPFAFLASGNNTDAYVVDPVTSQVWTTGLSSLPQGLLEQLQSTNMEFEQRGDVLYCAGGYGYSSTAGDHITFPNLTAIDLPGVMDAIRNGSPIAPFFRQVTDPRMEVTGGQMRMIDDRFYLVGGQRFIGRYNPMGPDFGPGFIQQYTNAVRRFSIDDDGSELAISDYWEHVDTVNLHRRDYNMLPQVFPDGQIGLTVFSGVFQYAEDLPWLNTVDIRDTTITVVPVFEQLLNQYHTAHAGMYDSTTHVMRSLFFGGISRYYFNEENVLMDDMNVPFVSTISAVQRDGTGALTEAKVGAMPALLGASAEFIPWPGTPQDDNGILLHHRFTGDTIVLGHVAGGIESSAANIFFTNTGSESQASASIYRVLLVESAVMVGEERDASPGLQLSRDADVLHVMFRDVLSGEATLTITDTMGRTVITKAIEPVSGPRNKVDVGLSAMAPGAYLVEVRTGSRAMVERFVR